MNFYTNTTHDQFIQWLRYAAIEGGMSTQFIDCVDALDAMTDLEAALETAQEESHSFEKDRDDLLSELEDLRDAVQDQSDIDPGSMSEALLAALKWANKAIERHNGK